MDFDPFYFPCIIEQVVGRLFFNSLPTPPYLRFNGEHLSIHLNFLEEQRLCLYQQIEILGSLLLQ